MRFGYVTILVAAMAGWTMGADPAARPADADLKAISAQIVGSAEERQAAIAGMRDMLQQQPPRASAALRSTWGKQLLETKEFAALDELCLATILASAGDTGSVEALLQLRIRGAIAQGKTDVALGHAKSLYNVATMSSTSNAMLLVAEALGAAGDKAELDLFKQEQLAGAKLTTRPTTSAYDERPTYGSTVLASIRVDAEPYLQKARSTFAEDYWSLQLRGNLMLLADRPAEAKELFERAYSAAPENMLNHASESLARQMKAQDGVIGRANRWVTAIRPAQAGGR